MAHGHDPKIPGRAAGTAGTGPETADCGCGRGWAAADLAARGERGRSAGRDPTGEDAGCGAAGVFCGDFDDYAYGAGAGARTIRGEPGILLPAGPAVGGARVSGCAKTAHAGAGGDGVLAESAEWVLSPWDSRGGGERENLRSLLAALQNAAPVVEAAAGAAGGSSCPKPDRRRAPARDWLRAGAGLGGGESEVRCARGGRGRGDAAVEGEVSRAAFCGCGQHARGRGSGAAGGVAAAAQWRCEVGNGSGAAASGAVCGGGGAA